MFLPVLQPEYQLRCFLPAQAFSQLVAQPGRGRGEVGHHLPRVRAVVGFVGTSVGYGHFEERPAIGWLDGDHDQRLQPRVAAVGQTHLDELADLAAEPTATPDVFLFFLAALAVPMQPVGVVVFLEFRVFEFKVDAKIAPGRVAASFIAHGKTSRLPGRSYAAIAQPDPGGVGVGCGIRPFGGGGLSVYQKTSSRFGGSTTRQDLAFKDSHGDTSRADRPMGAAKISGDDTRFNSFYLKTRFFIRAIYAEVRRRKQRVACDRVRAYKRR